MNAVKLKPIAWGTRDPRLAKLVCQSIADTTPPLVVRFNPRVFRALKRALAHLVAL